MIKVKEGDLNIVRLDVFLMMQVNLLSSSYYYSGSDRIADAYYDAKEVLRLNGITHIETSDDTIKLEDIV